jgi:hypothetical protein
MIDISLVNRLFCGHKTRLRLWIKVRARKTACDADWAHGRSLWEEDVHPPLYLRRNPGFNPQPDELNFPIGCWLFDDIKQKLVYIFLGASQMHTMPVFTSRTLSLPSPKHTQSPQLAAVIRAVSIAIAGLVLVCSASAQPTSSSGNRAHVSTGGVEVVPINSSKPRHSENGFNASRPIRGAKGFGGGVFQRSSSNNLRSKSSAKQILLFPIRLGRVIVNALFARETKEITTPAKQIVLSGKVLDGEIVDEGTESVKLSLRLRLDFRNVSPESVLILKRDLEVVKRNIIAHHADAADQDYLFRFEAYPSIDRSPEWDQLRKKVKYPLPQSDVVRILSPNEVWSWETTDWFMIGKRTNIDRNSKPWAAIQQASPVWLKVTLELWPKNIEPDPGREELSLGKLLQHSWQPFGELQLGHVTSDPILLDFSSLTTSVASRKNN